MQNTIAILIRDAPDDMRLGAQAIINGKTINVSALAFYDIFENNEKLEELVRDIAAGRIEDPEQAANDIMEKLKFL